MNKQIVNIAAWFAIKMPRAREAWEQSLISSERLLGRISDEEVKRKIENDLHPIIQQYRVLITNAVNGACAKGFTRVTIKLDAFKEGAKLNEIKYGQSELNTQFVLPRLSKELKFLQYETVYKKDETDKFTILWDSVHIEH
jgi:hypothetical protein